MGMNIDPALEAQIIHADNCKCSRCRDANARTCIPGEDMTEKDFSAKFWKLAESLGWDGYHTHDSRKSAAGYPDWTLWRERIVFAELKTEAGKTTAAQDTVIEGLRAAGGEVYVWRPSDWNQICEVLK
jgi:hypothetical protein